MEEITSLDEIKSMKEVKSMDEVKSIQEVTTTITNQMFWFSIFFVNEPMNQHNKNTQEAICLAITDTWSWFFFVLFNLRLFHHFLVTNSIWDLIIILIFTNSHFKVKSIEPVKSIQEVTEFLVFVYSSSSSNCRCHIWRKYIHLQCFSAFAPFSGETHLWADWRSSSRVERDGGEKVWRWLHYRWRLWKEIVLYSGENIRIHISRLITLPWVNYYPANPTELINLFDQEKKICWFVKNKYFFYC